MQATTTWDDLLSPGKATDFFARREFPPFDPATSEYSAVNALWLAELSRLMYRDPPLPLPSGNSFPSSSTYIRHVFFVDQGTDTQAMLVEFGGATPFAVLAFRGTEQHIKDIKTDLMIGKITLGGKMVEVHEGFQIALDSVWGKIKPELGALTCPVFFTGHSLGAALATLAAAKLAPKALYTYGSPMVGNQAFANSLVNIPIHRIVDGTDIVTRLPPNGFNFAHAGTEIQIRAGITNYILDWLKNPFAPPKPLADHAPVNYVDRI